MTVWQSDEVASNTHLFVFTPSPLACARCSKILLDQACPELAKGCGRQGEQDRVTELPV
jgi:hypothetical protein